MNARLPNVAAVDFGADDPLPTFRMLDDNHYRFERDDLGVAFEVDRVRRERNELVGELTVWCDLAGAQTVKGVLTSGDFNLSSIRVRKDRATYLAARARTTDLDWAGLLEELCAQVTAADRAGATSVYLRDVPRPEADAEIDADGLPLLRQHPVILFGDGGTGKSYLALHWAGTLALSGTRVLFCDWELSKEDHRLRLERLFGDEMPPVQYVRCTRPLVHEADGLVKLCRAEKIDLTINDSIAVACDGPPEAAEVAAGYFRALREIGVGSLNLAHITKGEHGDLKPFGSAFWSNLARSTWNVKLSASVGERITVGLFHRKANLTGLQPAIGYELDFGQGRTAVRRVSVADSPDLADNLPLWQRMKHAVAHQPLTVAVLADELGAKVDTLERTARRYSKLFTRVNGSDGIARIALVDRRPS